ncbi:MAG: MGMT family protein [Candidatus Lokiarchaeota archaeon]|nr:MGMT family protein [Candidatus Lokiarchaeota archaeon]
MAEQEILEKIERLFVDHFSGKLVDLFAEIQKLNVELDVKSKYKSEFAYNVLEFLIKVKPGETTSYYEIGSQIGSKAYRAIGNACRSNPIPLIVPCHRVLKRNGEIGGFMGKNSDNEWETNLKKEILMLEKAKL